MRDCQFKICISISDGETPFHGLETLIDHCQKDGQGLPCVLGNAIKKDPPPPDTRSHGRSNLLHRATKEGKFIKFYFSSLLLSIYETILFNNLPRTVEVRLPIKTLMKRK